MSSWNCQVYISLLLFHSVSAKTNQIEFWYHNRCTETLLAICALLCLLESHSRGFCETMRSLQVELPTPIFCIFRTTRLCGDSPSRTRCCCGWADQPENDTFMTMLLNCNNLFGDINHDIGNGMALIFLKIIAHPRFWYMKRSRLGQGLHSLYVWSEPLLQVLQNIFLNTFLTFVSLHGFVTGIFCV